MKIVNDVAEQKSVRFEDLDEGQCFKFDKSGTGAFMKTDYDQGAVDLRNGQYFSGCRNVGEDVFPVNAEVHIIN